MSAAWSAGADDCFDIPGLIKSFMGSGEWGFDGPRHGGRSGTAGRSRSQGGGWAGFGGRPGFGRPPRAARGDVRSAVLALLTEQPMHGYQIIQEIGRRSAGAWKPSPGSVYPTLQQLEDEGLVRAQEQEGRRVYRLTEAGRADADERAEEFARMWDAYSPSADDTELGELIFQVGAAFVQVIKTGSPEQLDAARRVLARTRSDLYRILGDDDRDDDRGAESADPTR